MQTEKGCALSLYKGKSLEGLIFFKNPLFSAIFFAILYTYFPLFLTAETIIDKTKAPQNRNAVFQYRVPKGYDKNRREMYRVLVIFGGRNTMVL